jgi:NADP-dependent 3-hydroxy acid dehydrogenase YdfG
LRPERLPEPRFPAARAQARRGPERGECGALALRGRPPAALIGSPACHNNLQTEGKVVAITGAGSGLGEATARRLAAEGAKRVIGVRRLDRLQALAAELGLPAEAAVQTDVAKHEEVKRLVGRAVELHGRIEVILNNAGLMAHSPLERGKVEDWDRMIDVSLEGLYGIAAALPHMTAQKSGDIINVSSVAGHKVRPGTAVSGATKAGVLMISKGLRSR